MQKQAAFSLVLCLVSCLVLIAGALGGMGCGRTSPNNITISGAWALYPMTVKWAEEYKKLHPDVSFDIAAGGAGLGMTQALKKQVDIGMVSREIYQSEIDAGAFWVSVTKDAVVPVVNANHPAIGEILEKGMTRQQFIDIWINGTLTDWGDITSQKHAISVYTRSDSCGAAETWALYLDGHKQDNLRGTAIYGDPGVAKAVTDDVWGIGFNNIGYAYDMATGLQNASLRVVPIDINGNGRIDQDEDFYGTKQQLADAIADGLYPSPPARDLHFVTRDGFTGATADFVRWVLTDGQQYVDEAGYVALSDAKIQEGLDKLGNG